MILIIFLILGLYDFDNPQDVAELYASMKL